MKLISVLVSMSVALVLGACSPQQIGPSVDQTAETTRLVNNPPSTVVVTSSPTTVGDERITYLNKDGVTPFKTEPIVRSKTNYSAAGAAGTRAVTIGGDGITQVGTGPASAQLYWDGKTFAISTDRDSAADSFRFDPSTGAVEVKNFRVSSSDPTKALAVPLAELTKIVESLTPAQKEAAIAQIDANRDVLNVAVPTLADVLIKLLAPVP